MAGEYQPPREPSLPSFQALRSGLVTATLQLVCPGCSGTHGSRTGSEWADLERARRAATFIPDGTYRPIEPRDFAFDLYPKMRTKAKATRLEFRVWDHYYYWLQARAQEVHKKYTINVTAPSYGLRPDDHRHAWFDRVFFDYDGTLPWDQLARVFAHYGIAAIFHESSGSVEHRTNGGAGTTGWHVEIPLASRIMDIWGCDQPDRPQGEAAAHWNHYKDELKRAYHHTAAVFAGLAGFPGIGGKCGFDLTTDRLCNLRFIGSRSVPNGPLPSLFRIPGNNGLDWSAFLAATGFCWKQYQEPRGSQRAVRVKLADGRVRERSVSAFSDQLFEDVKNALSITDYFRIYLRQTPTGKSPKGHNYFCPIHLEAGNPSGLSGGPNKRGFDVFPHYSGGFEVWNCYGDCRDAGRVHSGDVITLHAQMRGISNGKAALDLAGPDYLDLDTDQYVTRADLGPDPGYDEERPEGFDELVEGDRHRRKRTKARQLDHVADWLEDHVLGSGRKSLNAVRAMARVLLEGEEAKEAKKEKSQARAPCAGIDGRVAKNEKKAKDKLVIRNDPEEIAATIYAVMHETVTLDQATGIVYEIVERLQTDRPACGRPWIRNTLGSQALFELGIALWRDEREHGLPPQSFMDAMRRTLSFDLYVRGTPGRRVLYTIARDLEQQTLGSEDSSQTGAPCEGVDGTEAEDADYKKDRVATARRLRRPLGCMKTIQERKTTLGREMKPITTCCGGRGCVRCVMVEASREWEYMLPIWREAGEGSKFYVAQLELETWDQVDEVKYEMRKVARPKFSVTGINRGKPRLTYVSTNVVDQAATMGKLGVCHYLTSAGRGGRGAGRVNKDALVEWDTQDAEVALATVMREKLSVTVWMRDLVHQGEQAVIALKAGETTVEEAQKPFDEIVALNRWAFRRQLIVTRSKHALPWVTKEQLKAAFRRDDDDEIELIEGEKICYTCLHRETRVKLGYRVGRPFPIDDTVRLTILHADRIKEVQRELSAGARSVAARARAPAA